MNGVGVFLFCAVEDMLLYGDGAPIFRFLIVVCLILRTDTEIGGKGTGRWERKGFIVAVGWVGQEHGEYEVVGHLAGYRMAVVRRNLAEYQ